jgi:quinol monooxygenase YgiN
MVIGAWHHIYFLLLFLFFEEYADQKAIQAHGQHLKELAVDISGFLDGPVVAEYYDKIAY